MKKKVLLRLLGIAIAVVLFLTILVSTTNMPNDKSNGFYRKWITDEYLPELKTINLKESVSRIVGYTEHSIFLGGESNYGILVLDKKYNNKDTIVIRTNVPEKKRVPFYMLVDSPMIYLHVNNERKFYYGKIPRDTIRHRDVNSGVFSRSIQISPSSVIVRGFSDSLAYPIFKKIDILTGQITAQQKVASGEGEDASMGMANDGTLLYDKAGSSIYYIEFFRNRYYCLDTNLRIRYERQTIDTISTNSISIIEEEKTDSTQKFVPNKARIKVNYGGLVDRENLYIISGIRGDDQAIGEFNSSITFDVYDKNIGDYRGSFKIEKSDLKFANSYYLMQDTLLVLFKGQLKFYKIN